MQVQAMSDVHFHCPTHERDIDSGIDVDDETRRRLRLNLVHVPCPWCGRLHRFLLADAKQALPVVPDAPRLWAA